VTTSFLVIASNLIVLERLKSDFGAAATFRRDPLVPAEWQPAFDLSVLLQDDAAPVTSRDLSTRPAAARLASRRGSA